MKPTRIQRKRAKGWKMPENTVSVCRPGKWGNPFSVLPHVNPGGKVSSRGYIAVPTIEDAIACYRMRLEEKPEIAAAAKAELRGKNLACFCALDKPCHADILLEIANERR
ncbi:Protein of unknown function DUF4326) [uncultured Caudovirales phage]|uniref:DUF4326 domain-containing protein n=1 Tax=uncultured Caudovirales phage TaxID=2100421 RepID=A0A6J5M388_9CAUD|nr:Protein of unknown function DUF4326) [uncultured Caudovirales phage]